MPILLLTVHLLTVNLTKKAHQFSAKADAAKKLIFIYLKTHSHVLFVCTLYIPDKKLNRDSLLSSYIYVLVYSYAYSLLLPDKKLSGDSCAAWNTIVLFNQKKRFRSFDKH